MPADPRILRSLPELIKLYKGLVISSFFLGFIPLIFYWILSLTKRTKKLSYDQKFPLAMSSMVYFLTFGIGAPFATLWWTLRLGFKSLRLQMALQTLFFVNFFAFVGTESGQPSSDISTGLFLIGVFNSFYGFKKVKDSLVASEGITTKKQPEDSQSIPPRTAKVEVRENEDGAQIVGKQRTWEEVEKFFIHSLSSKRGKRFIFEIESDVYKDIYFQGYSEPDQSRTIEAAADLSVRPKLSDKQKLAISVIGWDLPSEDLPNFIMFLETNESGDQSLAQVFTRTLREGYGLELGTFSVIAPVR